MSRERLAENVYLAPDEDAVIILDQTKLPNEEEYLSLSTAEDMVEALQSMRVRGAPVIGIFAAYSLYVLARQIEADSYEDFYEQLHQQVDFLNSSRPTAANLRWALDRMESLVQAHKRASLPEIVQMIGDEAEAIQREDIQMCRQIAENGLTLLEEGDGILTHCNAGALAASRYGTALGPILLGHDQGMDIHVYVGETRPLLQGARLTSYELYREGVDVTLICDNMVSTVMTNGDGILIEMREAEEVRSAYFSEPIAPEGVACYNPSFDVTDHSMITAIITEKGVFYPPYDRTLAEALS